MMRLGVALGNTFDNDNESVTSLEYHKPNNSTIGDYLIIPIFRLRNK